MAIPLLVEPNVNVFVGAEVTRPSLLLDASKTVLVFNTNVLPLAQSIFKDVTHVILSESSIITPEFCISFHVAKSYLAIALSVAEAGHTTSQDPDQTEFISTSILPSTVLSIAVIDMFVPSIKLISGLVQTGVQFKETKIEESHPHVLHLLDLLNV